jgi:hypothetical protein
MQASPIINSFVAGELSPRLAGRTDIQQYYQSASEIRNMLVEFYGGAKKAPGTYFVSEVKDSSLATRLKRFVFSDTQAYILEFGNQYIRFYKDDATTGKGGAVLETHKDIISVSIATGVITVTSHGFSDGDTVYIDEIVGTTELNGKRYLIDNASTHTFTLTDIDGTAIDTTGYTAYSSGGEVSRVYTLTSGVDYLTADLFELQFAQKEDVLYITHPDYPQAELTRTAHTSWTLTDIDYSTGENRPALMPENITATTIEPSATTGNITLTSSGASLFDETHIGSIWAIGSITGTHGYAQIVTVSTGGLKTVCTATVLYSGTLPAGATTSWSEAAWSGYRGYPKSVTLYENRLIYGYTKAQPQTTWESAIGAYKTFEIGTDSADPMSFKADTNEVEVINWLYPSEEILIGTGSGLHSLGTGSDTTALTPTTTRIKKKSKFPASSLMPYQIGNYVYYWQKYNRILREYAYALDVDNFQTNDATAFSEHITESGIVEMDYQQSPMNILWCVRDDGKLAAFTRQIEQKVSAWTLHDTDGYYESVAVIPKESYDEVWFIVKRTIEGVTRRYVEYMVAPEVDEQEDLFFVHSGLTLDDPKTITNATQANPVVITCANDFSDGDIVKIRGLVERYAGEIPQKTLDAFEYYSNANAQENYVSNDPIRSNADIDDEDMADISDWVDADAVNGASTQVTFDGASCMKLDSGAAADGSFARRNQDVGTFGARTVFSYRAYFDKLGTQANNDFSQIYIYNGTNYLPIGFASEGLYIFQTSSWVLKGADVVQDVWQEWTFDIDWSGLTVDVYLDKTLKYENVPFALTSATVNGTITLQQSGYNTANCITYIDWVKVGTSMGSLDCLSENTIKTQGSYSLKVVAGTGSLNKTLTRTISPTIDLTGIDEIEFDIYALRTGANIKIGIHDSGGTTTEKTYTVLNSNTWETVTWDISAVADTDKDAIDNIIITMVNADAENIFYLDNMFTTVVPAATVGMTELNDNEYIVAGASGTGFSLKDLDGVNVDGTAFTAYDTGGEARKCVNEVSGLDHLIGENVQVFTDGAYHPDRTVTADGSITLNGYYAHISVGLGYTARLKTNDLEAQPGGVTSQGKTKRVSEIKANLLESLDFTVGTDEKMDDLTVRDVALADAEITPLYTGIKPLPFPSGWDTKKQIVIEQEKCLPLYILSIVASMEMNG